MMMITVFIVIMTFLMVVSKRITMLVNAFAAQSAFLALLALSRAVATVRPSSTP